MIEVRWSTWRDDKSYTFENQDDVVVGPFGATDHLNWKQYVKWHAENLAICIWVNGQCVYLADHRSHTWLVDIETYEPVL